MCRAPIFSTEVCKRGLFYLWSSMFTFFTLQVHEYYVGHTESIDNRLYEHRNSKGGKSSKTCAPWQLMHNETYTTRSDAMKRGREVKGKKSRGWIESWINSHSQSRRPIVRVKINPTRTRSRNKKSRKVISNR